MRLAARLLHLLRKDLGKPRATFLQLLDVDNFETFVNCSLNACRVNEDDELKHPSTAIELGYDIERLAAAKGTYAIKKKRRPEKRSIRLPLLGQFRVEDQGEKGACCLLEERKFNKPSELSIPEDIVTLAQYLVSSLKVVDLKADPDPILFSRVAVLAEARLLLFNKRRPGELEAIT